MPVSVLGLLSYTYLKERISRNFLKTERRRILVGMGEWRKRNSKNGRRSEPKYRSTFQEQERDREKGATEMFNEEPLPEKQ